MATGSFTRVNGAFLCRCFGKVARHHFRVYWGDGEILAIDINDGQWKPADLSPEGIELMIRTLSRDTPALTAKVGARYTK